jgi:hypothetical protein
MNTSRMIRIFAGANLFQSGFTGFCPLARILVKLGRTRAPF